MSFVQVLQAKLEDEERRTVGASFGGSGPSASYSIPSIRDWILQNADAPDCPIRSQFAALSHNLDKRSFRYLIGSTIRFAFLIELTDLKVGSTKMKTRWLPGLILMPQDS
ncbi:MAG: hypothetical protein RIB59_02040, partial [Rhodospirillales bacterium]